MFASLWCWLIKEGKVHHKAPRKLPAPVGGLRYLLIVPQRHDATFLFPESESASAIEETYFTWTRGEG